MQVSVHAAKPVPTRKSNVRLGSLAGKVAPPDNTFLAPLVEEELKDWGAL